MRLNLGAGDKAAYLAGYWNLDAKTGDTLYPLKYADNSADEIRCSHTLEHFSYHQTLDVLKEWVRVLKPGGWLKIAVPDFDWITLARDKGSYSVAQLEAYLMGGQTDENDYHKAIFTDVRLESLLEQCGLVNIQSWTSEIQDCASLPVSLNLMGQKPEIPDVPDFDEMMAKMGWLEAQDDREQAGGRIPLTDKLLPRCKRCKKRGALPDSEYCSATCAEQPTSRTQVFAAGRWQDLDGTVECADEDEIARAKAGQLQMRTIHLAEKRAARIALCLSTPRIGFLRPLERLLGLSYHAGISLFSGDGVFWHHSLSRSIKNAVEFDFEDGSDGFDFILTADYDTYAVLDDIHALAALLARSPEADCVVSLQMKRGGTGEVLAGSGQALNLSLPLVPIETGHFGLTLFRKDFFTRLPKPWFFERPDPNGDWGEGRVDADIGFWNNAKRAGLKVMLAPGVVVGHGEELITYPRIENGKPVKVYQAVNDWLSVRTKPEGIGVV